MSVFFSRFMGYESQCGTNKSHENRFSVHAICLFRTAIHIPWTEKKRHSFLKNTVTYADNSGLFYVNYFSFYIYFYWNGEGRKLTMVSESMRPFPFQCFIISLDKGYVPEKLWKLYIIDKKSISQLEDYTYRAISRNGGKSKRTDGAMKCTWQEMSRRSHSFNVTAERQAPPCERAVGQWRNSIDTCCSTAI